MKKHYIRLAITITAIVMCVTACQKLEDKKHNTPINPTTITSDSELSNTLANEETSETNFEALQ